MIVCLAVAVENDGDFRIDAGACFVLHICTGGEREPINSFCGVGREIAAASVDVGCTCADLGPHVTMRSVKPNGDAHGRLAEHGVENMCRNPAHCVSHFPRRICMICRCCSAASRSSVCLSLLKRR